MLVAKARLENVTNPYQTNARKVLCLCSAGMLRSPTIANTLHKEYGYNTRAAGVDAHYALIPVDSVLLEWADEIVCAEGSVYRTLTKHYSLDDINRYIVVLNIPDRFSWNDPELVALIKKQYADSSIMEKAFAKEAKS